MQYELSPEFKVSLTQGAYKTEYRACMFEAEIEGIKGYNDLMDLIDIARDDGVDINYLCLTDARNALHAYFDTQYKR